ncbi:copper resistance CopC/CopD family protein [Streptomyces tsukubensis]|uniref:copper resistance CopC/CopD family protein n=1 Tax=Streptomyces tsukubensis TaxID=83656 RepID=UPI003450D8C7
MTTTTAPPRPPVLRLPAGGPVRALLAALVLAATVFGTLLTAAGPAAAHAALTASSPKDGAVVATAPAEVSLTFSEHLAMGDDSIRVLEPGGKRADTGTVRDLSADGRVVHAVGLRTGLPNGTYTVAWQAVSADSHPISGAFTFSIGAPSATTVPLPGGETGGGLVGFLYDAARYTSYGGFALMVGGAAFVLLCWPRGASVRPLQRLVARSWTVLTGATLAMLLLRVPYAGSGRLADVFDLAGLQDVLETKTGAALVSRLLLLGAAALFIAVLFSTYAQRVRAAAADDGDGTGDEAEGKGGGRADPAFGLGVGGTVVSAGIAATWALSEHASTGIQTGLAMPVDVVHLLAVAGWLGGLAALLIALRREPSIEPAAVRRFSTVAFVCVVALAVTGLYQSWRQVGSWSALTGTEYGRLLLAKAALVAVLVVIARFSRRWTARLVTAPAVPGPQKSPDAGDTTAAAATTDTTAAAADTAVAEPSDRSEKSAESARPGEPGEPGEAEENGTRSAVGPARAAQLARQRTALADAARRKARDADPVRSGLRRAVLAEAAVAAVVLAVTTVLTATEPGRTEETADRAALSGGSPSADSRPGGPVDTTIPFDTGGPNGKGTIRLTLGPAAPGANGLTLRITGTAGKPLEAPEVKASFTLPDQQIGPLPVTPVKVAPGQWRADRVQIPMPGDWLVKVTVRTSDIDQTTVDENVKIG